MKHFFQELKATISHHRRPILSLLVIALALGVGLRATESRPAEAQSQQRRPNIVVIMTDDMTVDQLQYMPQTNKLLKQKGLYFNNFITSYPLCCPSRATLLSGQYDHNNGVRDNFAPDGAIQAFNRMAQSTTLPSVLKDSGYTTILSGKYLNGYSANQGVMPGWSDWNSFAAGSGQEYYNYKLNTNGTVLSFGSQPSDYSTDVFGNLAVSAVKRASNKAKPFFLLYTPFAPHIEGGGNSANPPRVAPRHQNIYSHVQPPRPPSYMEEDTSDKAPFLRNNPLTDRSFKPEYTIGHIYRKEIESLRAVDDAVKKIVDTTIRQNEYDNTYFIFYSDNGYAHGEHRITHGKNYPYEEHIKVPFIIAGPNAPQGSVNNLTSNVDLSATILDLANVNPGRVQDGVSLRKYFRRPNFQDDRAIILRGRWNTRTNTYGFQGLRTNRYTYIRWNGGYVELYDLQNDPYQLESKHNDPAYAEIKSKLAQHFEKIKDCRGGGCQASIVLDQ